MHYNNSIIQGLLFFSFVCCLGCNIQRIRILDNFVKDLETDKSFMENFNNGFNQTNLGRKTKQIINRALQSEHIETSGNCFIISGRRAYCTYEIEKIDGLTAVITWYYKWFGGIESEGGTGSDKIILVKENGEWKIYGPIFFNHLYFILQQFNDFEFLDIDKYGDIKQVLIQYYHSRNYSHIYSTHVRMNMLKREMNDHTRKNKLTRKPYFHWILNMRKQEHISFITCEYSIPKIQGGKMLGWQLTQATIKLIKKNGKWLIDGKSLVKNDPILRHAVSDPESLLTSPNDEE